MLNINSLPSDSRDGMQSNEYSYHVWLNSENAKETENVVALTDAESSRQSVCRQLHCQALSNRLACITNEHSPLSFISSE